MRGDSGLGDTKGVDLKLRSRVWTGKEPGIGGKIAVSSSAEARIVADNLKGERVGSGGKVEVELETSSEPKLAILAIDFILHEVSARLPIK